MKILKRGTPESERVFQGTCRCGTKVEFHQREGKITYDQRDGDFIEVACPICQNRIIVSIGITQEQNMVPDQKFNCPHCGAPGQVTNGQPEYSCQCRFGHMFAPQPYPYYPAPVTPYQPYTPNHPFYPTITWGNNGLSNGAQAAY